MPESSNESDADMAASTLSSTSEPESPSEDVATEAGEQAVQELTADRVIKPLKGYVMPGSCIRLDKEEDVEKFLESVKGKKDVGYLSFTTNTIGPQASRAIRVALADHGEMKAAYLPNIFGTRSLEELPEALSEIVSGYVAAGCRLKLIDFSDNAFGRAALTKLAPLFESDGTLWKLEVLHLNNNGLGQQGARELSRLLGVLLDKAPKNKIPLKEIICGRNRLENPGARALAGVLDKFEALEIVQLPQNGIFEEGVCALLNSLKNMRNLKELNLEDNCVKAKGVQIITNCMKDTWKGLEKLNLSCTLIGYRGCIAICNAIIDYNIPIKELKFNANDIGKHCTDVLSLLVRINTLKSFEIEDNDIAEFMVDELQLILQNTNKLGFMECLPEPLSDDEYFDEGSDEEDETYDTGVIEPDSDSSYDDEPIVRKELPNVVPSVSNAAQSFPSPAMDFVVPSDKDIALAKIIQAMKEFPQADPSFFTKNRAGIEEITKIINAAGNASNSCAQLYLAIENLVSLLGDTVSEKNAHAIMIPLVNLTAKRGLIVNFCEAIICFISKFRNAQFAKQKPLDSRSTKGLCVMMEQVYKILPHYATNQVMAMRNAIMIVHMNNYWRSELNQDCIMKLNSLIFA